MSRDDEDDRFGISGSSSTSRPQMGMGGGQGNRQGGNARPDNSSSSQPRKVIVNGGGKSVSQPSGKTASDKGQVKMSTGGKRKLSRENVGKGMLIVAQILLFLIAFAGSVFWSLPQTADFLQASMFRVNVPFLWGAALFIQLFPTFCISIAGIKRGVDRKIWVYLFWIVTAIDMITNVGAIIVYDLTPIAQRDGFRLGWQTLSFATYLFIGVAVVWAEEVMMDLLSNDNVILDWQKFFTVAQMKD